MNTCKYILKKGEHKGEVCGMGCRNGEFCRSHNGKKREWRKQYYNLNRDQIQYHMKKYYQDNKEHIKQTKKEYRKKYKEEISIQKKKSRCKHWDNIVVSTCKRCDKRDNYYFNLNVDWIHKILDHQEWQCFHCNKYLLLENGNNDLDQLSVDRVDHSKGHIRGNVILSCWDCNHTRQKKDINVFTPHPKYSILKDNESSEETDDYSEETDISTSQTGNQNCNQM